jgi:uncharacterized membrane protein
MSPRDDTDGGPTPEGRRADAEPPSGEPTPSAAAANGFERILFFSDAVFAIAITLLVLPLAEAGIHEGHVGRQIADLWPQLESFAISFIVIGAYWTSHHSSFQEITAFDGVLLKLNMAFLFCIVFMPFPTEVLGARDDSTASTVLYAGSVGMTGAVNAAMWWWASHDRRLLASWVTSEAIRTRLLVRLAAPVVFLVSIPVAFASPSYARYVWILIYPASLVARRLGRAR